jgi:hypothetical protein
MPTHNWARDGFPLTPWTNVATLELEPDDRGYYRITTGQKLPKSFLWGDPTNQIYGWGGPSLVYGPMELRCTTCRDRFVWSARAQKHLFETIAAHGDTIATQCRPCAQRRRALEDARASYAAALTACKEAPTGPAHAKVAASMLALLEAGGRVSLDKAIGHCTRARKLGVTRGVAATERDLRARR